MAAGARVTTTGSRLSQIARRFKAIEPRIGDRRALGVRLLTLLLAAVTMRLYLPESAPLWLTLLVLASTALLALTASLPLVAWTGAWAGFLLLRGRADDIGFPDRGQTLLEIDRWLGFGLTPTERVQDAFGFGGVDTLALGVHLSYFVVPHLVALGIWLVCVRRQRLAAFWRYLLATGIVMALGIALHVIVPASPPWMLAEDRSALEIERVVSGVNSGGPSGAGEEAFVADRNPIAAMPSLHLALSLVAAIALWRADRRLGLAGFVYAAAMGFALVHLGEHWLIDVLVGGALALIGAWIAPRVWPPECDADRPHRVSSGAHG
jgi:membrane-associated phospholipid phosphatase